MKAKVTNLFHNTISQHLILPTLVWFSYMTSHIADILLFIKMIYPYFEAISLALSSSITLSSSRSALFPHSTMSGFSQYACVCNCDIQFRMFTNDCSLVRSKSSRKPIASRKKAVVKLRNLQHKSYSNITLSEPAIVDVSQKVYNSYEILS